MKRSYVKKTKFRPRKRFVSKKRSYGGRKKYRQGVKVKSTVFPSTVYVKLKYHETFNTTSGASKISTYRANDIYDPQTLTGGTHPTGYSQWMAMFNRFVVGASKITVRATNLSDTTNCNMFVQANTVAGIGGGSDLFTTPNTFMKSLGPKTSSRSCVTTTMYRKSTGMFGRKVNQDDQFWGTYSRPPDKQWYWNVYFANHDSTTLNIQYDVTIKYYVRFFEKINNVPVSTGLTGPDGGVLTENQNDNPNAIVPPVYV